MGLDMRKFLVQVEEVLCEGGVLADRPLRKVAAIAVLKNPFAGQYVEDLNPLIVAGRELGTFLGRRAADALGEPVESYGKGGLVGEAGEQEHANALLTSLFGDALRETIGGGKAWISSVTKKGKAGDSIDIPVNYKDALWVRSHYDALTVRVPDAPLPDEIVLIAAVTNRGRLNARVGGLRKEDVMGLDGLR